MTRAGDKIIEGLTEALQHARDSRSAPAGEDPVEGLRAKPASDGGEANRPNSVLPPSLQDERVAIAAIANMLGDGCSCRTGAGDMALAQRIVAKVAALSPSQPEADEVATDGMREALAKASRDLDLIANAICCGGSVSPDYVLRAARSARAALSPAQASDPTLGCMADWPATPLSDPSPWEADAKVERLRFALTTARDQFRFYEGQHKAKADNAAETLAWRKARKLYEDANPGTEAELADRREKELTNKRFADMSDPLPTPIPLPDELREMREACAKKAEWFDDPDAEQGKNIEWERGYNHACRKIAKAIRAMPIDTLTATKPSGQVERLTKLLADGWYVAGESYPIISVAADRWIKEVQTLGLEVLAALSPQSQPAAQSESHTA